MALTFGFASIREIFAKLERDAAALDEEVSGDRFFNFVVTGYSMIDWVKNDPTVPASAKACLEVQSLYDDRYLKVCGDLATAVKHFKLTQRTPSVTSAESERGCGVGRWGMGGFGVGEESIEITLNDGTSINGMDLVQGVLSKWKGFFAAHCL